MIEIWNMNEKIKNKDKWNYCHNMPILTLLGANNCIPLFYMYKRFIWLEETKEHINQFDIGYTINPNLHVNKAFKEQVINCMNNMFVALTHPSI